MITSFIPRKKIEIILVLLEIVLMVVLIALITKDLNEAWEAGWKTTLMLGFIYFGYLFFRIHVAEKKLLSLYNKRDIEIKNIESEPVQLRVIDGRTRMKELDFQSKISPLERQRKYDLEKIPFLRK